MMKPGAAARILRRLAVGIGLLAALAVAASAIAQPPSGIVHVPHERAKSPRELGSELYAANCASCHGVDGRGIQRPRPGAGNIQGAGPSLRGANASTCGRAAPRPCTRVTPGRPGRDPGACSPVPS